VKILINGCFGGFKLSKEIAKEWKKTTGRYIDRIISRSDPKVRSDPTLIEIVERIGCSKATRSSGSELYIETITLPLGHTFIIQEYDGLESVVICPPNYK